MSTHLLLSSSVFSNFHNLTRAQTHLLTLQSYTLGSVQWQGSSTRHNPPLPTPPLHTPRPTSTSRNQHKGKRQQERKKKKSGASLTHLCWMSFRGSWWMRALLIGVEPVGCTAEATMPSHR